MAYGNEYEGALVNFVYLLISKPNKLAAIQGAFYRDFGPNINNLLATVFVFLLVVWFQGWQVDIAVHNTQQRGSIGNHGIKLFYTSNMPIILMSALVSNVFFISKTLYKKFGSFFLVRWLGRWKEASRTWTEIGGSDSKKVYESLKRQKLTSYGGSDRLLRAKLDKYINLASSLGGICVGMLTIIADFLGAIGSGTGILLSCNIVCELYEVYKQEARTMVR